jgi:hypothetical protein
VVTAVAPLLTPVGKRAGGRGICKLPGFVTGPVTGCAPVGPGFPQSDPDSPAAVGSIAAVPPDAPPA